MTDGLEKKKSRQQTIDSQGKKLVEGILPKDPNNLSVEYLKQDGTDDFGIDAELQIIEKGNVLDLVCKVQLKSTESPRFLKRKNRLALSIDSRSLNQYVNKINVPMAVLLADVSNKKVYWNRTQTDKSLKLALDKSIKANKTSITIYFDESDELREDNFAELLEYFRRANAIVSKRDYTEALEGMSLVDAIEDNGANVSIEGFDLLTRRENDPIRDGTFVSMGRQGRIYTDLVANEGFRPELAPKVAVQLKFDPKDPEDQIRIDSWKNMLSAGEGRITLEAKNVEKFITTSGQRIIDDGSNKPKHIMLSPIRYKNKIILDNGSRRVELDGYSWFSKVDQKGYVATIKDQCIGLGLSLVLPKMKEIPSDGCVDLKINVKFSVNRKNATSLQEELSIFSFFAKSNSVRVSIRVKNDKNVQEFTLCEIPQENEIIKNFASWCELIKMMIEIEKATGIKIEYPLPDAISDVEAKNIWEIYTVIVERKSLFSKFSFKIKSGMDIATIGINDPVVLDNALQFSIFDKSYIDDSQKIRYVGKLERIESSADGYTAYVKDVSVSIHKTRG